MTYGRSSQHYVGFLRECLCEKCLSEMSVYM
jgi:hypothetical protein